MCPAEKLPRWKCCQSVLHESQCLAFAVQCARVVTLCHRPTVEGHNATVIVDILVCIHISYSSVCEILYAIHFHTARSVSHTLVCVHDIRMPLNFVGSA